MRISPQAGTTVIQVSTEVPVSDHALIRHVARQKQVSVHKLIRTWIEPHLVKARREKE